MMFQDVHFIRGSAQDEYALERASVFRAHTVILLAARRRLKSFRDPHMADSDAIATLKYVNDACQQRVKRQELDSMPRFVTEIRQNSNLKYLTWMLKVLLLL
jgi:hypothetical protein